MLFCERKDGGAANSDIIQVYQQGAVATHIYRVVVQVVMLSLGVSGDGEGEH